MSNKLVYSTDSSKAVQKEGKSGKAGGSTAMSTGGPCKIRLESKGRGGKSVTVIFNWSFSETQARDHLKDLQSQLGTGGTIKEGVIELRGDVRSKVEEYFAKKGVKVVRAGG